MLCEVAKDVVTQAPEVLDAVTSVVITTQRDTCVLLDKQGNVLRPAIIWADQRPLENPRSFRLKSKLALQATGMSKIAHILSDQCPAHWIQDHEPDIWAKTHKYMLLSGYLIYKLTGKFVDSVASQIGHIPFNYKKITWEKKGSIKRSVFQIEDEKLPELKFTGETFGAITKQTSADTGLKEGLKLIAGGSDKGCETLGVGCNDETIASVSLGSHATIQTTSDRYYEVHPFIPPFPAVVPYKYNPEIEVYRGYWMITWFKNEIGQKEVLEAKKKGVPPEDILVQELKEIPPGSDGLILMPYWGGGSENSGGKGGDYRIFRRAYESAYLPCHH